MSRRTTSSSGGSSIEDVAGKRYHAFLIKPKMGRRSTFSVCYAQFTFGVGSGETKEEAIGDAEYILAYGLQAMAVSGKTLPEPVEHSKAQELATERLTELHLSEADIDWVQIEVKPELVEGEVWD